MAAVFYTTRLLSLKHLPQIISAKRRKKMGIPVSQFDQELWIIFQVVVLVFSSGGWRLIVAELSEQVGQDRLVAELGDTCLNQISVQATEVLVMWQCLYYHYTGAIWMVVLLDHDAQNVAQVILENLFLLWPQVVVLTVLHEFVTQISDEAFFK